MFHRRLMADHEDDRVAAFEVVARMLAKRAATDRAVSEDGAQRALEELWAGPGDGYRDPITGRVDVDRLRRVSVLRAQSRTIDDRRKARPASLDTPAADGSGDTRGSLVAAPDDQLADRLDCASTLAELERRSSVASPRVRIGLRAIGLREAGYTDPEIAVTLGLSAAHLRQLICRARTWARAVDPRQRDRETPGSDDPASGSSAVSL